MKHVLRYLFLSSLVLSASEMSNGEKIYDKKCLSCHIKFIDMQKLKTNFLDNKNEDFNLKAPTLNQLSYRLKQRIGDASGDEDIHRMEVSAFISDYLVNPDRDKSVCLDEVMVYFETMPSMKGQITQEEIEEVSEYLYDFYTTPPSTASVVYGGFEEALIEAKKSHKIMMLKVTSPYCHFCRKMETKVLIQPKIKARLAQDFLVVPIDITKMKLPLGLKTQLTPSFIFVDEDTNILLNIPGAWNEEDFMTILKEAKAKSTQQEKR